MLKIESFAWKEEREISRYQKKKREFKTKMISS